MQEMASKVLLWLAFFCFLLSEIVKKVAKSLEFYHFLFIFAAET